jgi:hypothetical protein
MDLIAKDRGGTNWTDLAYDREKWKALVITVMNLQ